MATTPNPYSGAYNRAATRSMPTAETQAYNEALASGDTAGAWQAQQRGIANMLLGGANAGNNWTVTKYRDYPDGRKVPLILDRPTITKFLEPMSRPANDPNRAAGQDTLATWAQRNPGAVAFVDRYYPGLLDELVATQPESRGVIDETRKANGPVEVDANSPGLPAGYTPSTGATGTQAPATKNTKVEVPANQRPGALTAKQRRNITSKAQSMSPKQLQSRIDSIAATGGNQRRLQQMQNVAVNKAIGPMSAKNKALFNKVRNRRAQGLQVSAKTQKRLTNIKQNRADRYTKKTGNTYYKTGYKNPKPAIGAAPNFNNLAGLGTAFSQALAQGQASTAAKQNNNFNNLAPIIAAMTKKG